MVPTYGSSSGLPFGMPTMQDAGIPALDMSSYTVYEWMESELGLGLTKPLDTKVYAMIYQASMHHRGFFQINQSEFSKQLDVSRKTVTRTLKALVDAGLVISVAMSVGGPEGRGSLKTSSAYCVSQDAINAAVASVMDAKRLQAARAWSEAAPGTPLPTYLAPYFDAAPAVRGGAPSPSLGQNVPTSATCGNVEKPQVSSLGQNVPTIRPAETLKAAPSATSKPQVSSLGQFVPTIGQKCPNDTTCGNVESDKCLLEPSTCGSDNKTPVGDFDRSTYIEEGVRRKEDVGISGTINNVPLGSEPIRFVEPASPDAPSFRSLTCSEHEGLAAFLGNWPKDAGGPDAFEETARAWSRAMDAGFTTEGVIAAADAYLRDFYANHDVRADRTQMRFVMFPKSFLARPDGLRKWARLAGQDARPAQEDRGAEVKVTYLGGPDDGCWAYLDAHGNFSPLPCPRDAGADEARRVAIQQIEFHESFGKRDRKEGAA